MNVAQRIIPKSLAELDQWILWKYEPVPNSDRLTKVPYQPNGRKASSTDPTTWNELSIVRDVWIKEPKRWNGLGFVFSPEDPFCGIDLDECLDDTGTPKRWACGILEKFADTYAEVSPSGFGIKIFCKGVVPKGLKVPVDPAKPDEDAIEIYSAGRYFTVTGRRFRNAPPQIEEHASDVLTLYTDLAALAESRRRQDRRSNNQPAANGTIPVGRRHRFLVSICGYLQRRGVCDTAIQACLQEINAHQFEEPKPAEAIAQIVRSTGVWKEAQAQ